MSHGQHDIEKLLVERLAKGGDGIARLTDGRVAFVPGTCPGDIVRAEITEDHGNFVRARTTRLVEASPARVESSCPISDQCGGCHWRHVSYSAQLDAKRAEVADSLQRIAHLDPSIVTDPLPSPRTDGYRNKVEFAVDITGGKLRLGYTGDDGFVPVERCLLLPKSHAGAPKALAGALSYLAKGRDIGVSRVALRVSQRTREVEIALWGPPGAFPRQMASKVLAEAVKATSVVRVLVKGDSRKRHVTKVEVLAGKGHWTERLGGFSFGVSAPSFFQVNTEAAEHLVSVVTGGIPDPYDARVFDVYAGVGAFTLPLAAEGADVTAFEAEGSAVRDLRRNLERAHLYAEVMPGDAARSLAEAGPADAAIVDPPRAGLHPAALSTIAAAAPKHLVYVSCDPATLARDLGHLVGQGYGVSSVTPVDLFPHTYHIESVAVLTR